MLRRFRVLTRMLTGALVIATVSLAFPSGHAGAVTVTSGSCFLELSASWSPTLIEVTTPQPGVCAVPEDPSATGELTVDLTPLPGTSFSCSAAFGHSTNGDFRLVTDGGTGRWTDIEVETSKSGDTITLVARLIVGLEHLVAHGEFVQSPLSANVCLAGGNQLTWTGSFVFEDPVFDEE